MLKRFIPFGEPLLGQEEIEAVARVIKSGWIGMGPEVEKFEQEFASYVGAKNAVAVSSCTAALHLSLIVSDIGSGDEVILPSMTFASAANVIEHVGAKPVFADIDPATFNIDPQEIERKITKKTKAIMTVHFGGLACDMDAINRMAKKNSLVVIEDAAHALGTIYEGKKIGSGNNLTCFSFYPNKTITTIEGGMIALPNRRVAEKLKVLRMQGLTKDAWKRYRTKKLLISEVKMPGFKYNMTDVSAAIGRIQLRKIEKFLKQKIEYAKMADKEFSNIPGVKLQPKSFSKNNRHSLHLYLIILDDKKLISSRDQIVEELRRINIGIGIHYTALHLHPYYRKKYGQMSLSISEQFSKGTMSLPLTPKISETKMKTIIKETKGIFNNYLKK